MNGRKTTTNHVHEIERCLGIEAARSSIMREINVRYVFIKLLIIVRYTEGGGGAFVS